MQNTQKRQLLASMESEIQRLTQLDPKTIVKLDLSVLRSAFDKLVEVLALGPEPETRDCPSCGRKGMRNATICGYCWTKTPVHAA